MSITRRSLLAGGVAGAGIAALAACGGPSGTPTEVLPTGGENLELFDGTRTRDVSPG
jgi:hypothetical protein